MMYRKNVISFLRNTGFYNIFEVVRKIELGCKQKLFLVLVLKVPRNLYENITKYMYTLSTKCTSIYESRK